jgi:hypothetical protein
MSSSAVAGRVARTKGVSMLPHEIEDAGTVEELAGIGFSELYRRHLAPQVHVAAQMLRELHDAGMELDRARLRDGWDLTMTSEQLASVYTEPSELALGE